MDNEEVLDAAWADADAVIGMEQLEHWADLDENSVGPAPRIRDLRDYLGRHPTDEEFEQYSERYLAHLRAAVNAAWDELLKLPAEPTVEQYNEAVIAVSEAAEAA